MTATADQELTSLVDYRNDAAHGGIAVDEVAGLSVLLEFADFAVVLCSVIAQRVQKAFIELGRSKNLYQECGAITERLKKGTVIISPVVGDFFVGQSVYLCGDGFCTKRQILGIQLNGENKERISLRDRTELGFRLDAKGDRGAVIFVDVRETPRAI